MAVFKYGQKEMDYLSSKDETLGKAISCFGFIEREINLDLFQALAGSIISQQISGKAADNIWNRLVISIDEVNASNIISSNEETLRSCGISYRKITYLKSAAEFKLAGKLDEKEFSKLSDEEIISKLVAIKGVGIWTAEMLLIFSLQRENVLSLGDLGIKKGIKKLYGDSEITTERLKYYKDLYTPYGTIAAFYLWEVASGKWKVGETHE
jgi:3-methyladenine DNA glycosylase/8-oxoguanine DNA glycosylase